MSRPIPDELLHGPFTTAQAEARGYLRAGLRRACWVQLFRGVHVHRDVDVTPRVSIAAALLTVPPHRAPVVSHRSAVLLHGADLAGASRAPWELSTHGTAHSRHRDVTLHRRVGDVDTRVLDGLPVTGPERTIVDFAWKACLREVVQLVEHLVRGGSTSLDGLGRYLEHCHLDGVVRAREAMVLARTGSESVMETWLRLALVLAGLPEPEVNVDIRDPEGRFVARVDLLYRCCKVVVEYDGRHHEVDRRQWAHDRRRREWLESLGYRVVVVAALDLARPQDVVLRVHRALREAGCDVDRPWFSADWVHQFARSSAI